MTKSNPREGRGWPGYILGGRLRTSTAALLIAFFAILWLYETYETTAPPQQVPASEVVPPGFIPDPAYTWAPRTDVQKRTTETSTTPTTPTTSTTPTTPTESSTASTTAESSTTATPTPSPGKSPASSSLPTPEPSASPEPSPAAARQAGGGASAPVPPPQ